MGSALLKVFQIVFSVGFQRLCWIFIVLPLIHVKVAIFISLQGFLSCLKSVQRCQKNTVN